MTTNIINDVNADYWRYEVGVSVIPANTRQEVTYIQWSQWQDKPIPEELHNRWKEEGAFSNGMAVLLGRVWHKSDLVNYYLIGIDADNKKAIEEMCKLNGKSRTKGNCYNNHSRTT
jgi:hypothetical protein